MNTISPMNYINVNKDGTFNKSGNHRTDPEDIDDIIKEIQQTNKKKLLVYFHGGLINENRGRAAASTFLEKYTGDPDTHIVSIVWETGFLESLPETFNSILADSLLNRLVHKIRQYFGRKTGYEDVENACMAFDATPSIHGDAEFFQTTGIDEHSILEAFYANKIMGSSIDEVFIYYDMQQMLTDEELTEHDLRTLDAQALDKGFLINPKLLWYAAKIAYRCIVRFRDRRDHGLWPTIVEESVREIKIDWLGSKIWTTMKNQSSTMWKSNQGKLGNDRYVGRYLIDKISELKGVYDLKIQVIGHSAGSIAVAHLIDLLHNHYAFKLDAVVFLAPAIRCDTFLDKVLKSVAFERFRMFTMDDPTESDDALISVLYPRSLLYLISGILEGSEPGDKGDALLLGLHRHIRLRMPYHENPLLLAIHEYLFLPDATSRKLILSKSSGGPGRIADATKHGGFTFACEIVKSIKFFLAEEN